MIYAAAFGKVVTSQKFAVTDAFTGRRFKTIYKQPGHHTMLSLPNIQLLNAVQLQSNPALVGSPWGMTEFKF